MPLSDEIKQAAEVLGKQLGAVADVREFVSLAGKAQQDAEAAALEARFSQIYQHMLELQQCGQFLDRAELNEYYRLKREIQDHPMLSARDNQLVLVKALFAQTAQRLTDALGIDYTKVAR